MIMEAWYVPRFVDWARKLETQRDDFPARVVPEGSLFGEPGRTNVAGEVQRLSPGEFSLAWVDSGLQLVG